MATINDLALEVTRRCQMKCEHCLRGGAQRVDMTYDIAFNALTSFSNIGTLTITGGEPALNSKLISRILDIVIYYGGVHIDSFYIVTNGLKYLGEEVMDKLDYIYNRVVYEKEMCGLSISFDQYHKVFYKNSIDRNIERYERFGFYRPDEKNQFIGFRGQKQQGFTPRQLLAEGRAKDFGGKTEFYDDDILEVSEGNYAGLLYVNALGKLISGCNYSYNTQKKKVVGTYDRINDFLLSCPKSKDYY